MKRLAVHLISIITFAGAAVAIHYFCILPLRGSITERRLEQATLQLAQFPDRRGTAQQVLKNLQQANACIKVRPTRVNLYVIAALNYRLIGQDARAVQSYEDALRCDQRPEIYAGLGNAQSHTGNRREAIENLFRANIFWPSGGDDIEDAFVHDEVLRRIAEYESALKNHR